MCPDGFPVGSLGSVVKDQPANAGDTGNSGSILGSWRKQQPNLVFLHENYMNRVHGLQKSDMTKHARTHALKERSS